MPPSGGQLMMTLTFDLLTPKPNRVIFVPKISQKFHEGGRHQKQYRTV